ncbi:hypothetical protein [Sphingomonas sp. BK235]|jgi:hypothetical protein|nr:hypothetical protein [Sphingomonas sp. BK235]TCP35847.1 hypothetical protein EV292_102436 [Sphingomonas sp. BK235]
MTRLIKSSFARQFAGGFLIGAVAMLGIHASQAETPTHAYAATHVAR